VQKERGGEERASPIRRRTPQLHAKPGRKERKKTLRKGKKKRKGGRDELARMRLLCGAGLGARRRQEKRRKSLPERKEGGGIVFRPAPRT